MLDKEPGSGFGGSGFRVQGSEVQGSGFRVQGSEVQRFRVQRLLSFHDCGHLTTMVAISVKVG